MHAHNMQFQRRAAAATAAHQIGTMPTLPPMSPAHLAAPARVVSQLPPVILHLPVLTLCDLDQLYLSLT